MKGILIDLDGVVYQNNKPIAGAADTIQWLRSQNIPHLFVTNTTSKPRAAIVEKLHEMGITVAEDDIVTPVVAALTYMSQLRNPRIALYVPEKTLSEFIGCQLVSQNEQPDAIILGDLGEAWSFALLNKAFRQLIGNKSCQLLALGMTRYWSGPQGLQMDVGPFVQALSFAANKQPVVLGKPAEAFFDLAAEKLGINKRDLAMIGDDAISDVQAAQKCGLRGILVKTGKFRQEDLNVTHPDIVIENFAQLPHVWR